jgi:uncharacterized protein (DUF2164 family)
MYLTADIQLNRDELSRALRDYLSNEHGIDVEDFDGMQEMKFDGESLTFKASWEPQG